MSSDLIWEVIKDQNCFLKKINGTQFSAEPTNLLNLNSYKYSGLVGEKVIGVTAGPEGKGVRISTQKRASLNKPAKRTSSTVISRSGTRRAVKSVNGLVKNHYRPDLKKAALARVSYIIRSQRKGDTKPVKTGRVNHKLVKADK